MKKLVRLFLYRKKVIVPYIDVLLKLLNSVSIFAAALLLITIVFEYGYVVTAEEYHMIGEIYDFTWLVFIFNSLAHIAFDFKKTVEQYGKLAWVMNSLLYLTILPALFTPPTFKVLYLIWQFIESRLYYSIVLAVLAILILMDWVVKKLGKKINPSFIFAFSFFAIIMIGAGLLMLPKATFNGISFIDALFTSTSATCVTGLTSVDVTTTFTQFGIFIIMVLIQIGGMGVMTITSFFALFFMGNTSLSNQSLLSEMVSSKSLSSLLTTLLYIFGFTIVIETVGAIAIFTNIHSTMGMTLQEEIIFSVFHSISAFCNAGFSTLPSNLGNPLLMNGHNLFYIIISVLIILGGIGFPILVNLYDWFKYIFRRLYRNYIRKTHLVERQVHIYDINTKIAIAMTVILIVVGTVTIAALEWNSAFEGMAVTDKWVQSFFTAVCPRTAGFASVSMGSFTIQTILLMIFLMVIGGGSQSTAGGIKVNAFAVILLNIKSMICGNERVTIFNRTLSTDSIRRSNSTLVLYILIVFISVFMISIFEPEQSLLAIVFESISALSTVGASLDLTSTLGSDSKLLLVLLMFIGRVGVLTTIASLIKQHKYKNVQYPSGNIIIN